MTFVCPIEVTLNLGGILLFYTCLSSSDFSWYWGRQLNISFLLCAVMVLIYVVYSRRRESTVRYAGPDDDVRENIINYEDEGGGEDDMTAYDITPLQIPIGGHGLGLGYDTMKGGKIPCQFLILNYHFLISPN